MKNCSVFIVDTLNNKALNSKNVKNILEDVLAADCHIFDSKNSFFGKNVEIIEFNKDCDHIDIEKSLIKEHLFVNIISSNYRQQRESMAIFDFDKSLKDENHNCFHYRHFNFLNHAFTSRNKNAIYLVVDDDGLSCSSETNFIESWIEINWFGFKTEICRDQMINISSSFSYDEELKKWFLQKLISMEGNFPFYCLPILSKMISFYGGLMAMDESPSYIGECSSEAQDYYVGMVTSLLSTMDFPSSSKDYNRPMFLSADCNVEWGAVKNVIYSRYSRHSNYIGLYRCRLHPVYQNINLLLVCLLRFFKVFPQDGQLPFTTSQMATLVCECLRTGGSLPTTKKFTFVIEDIDWIAGNTTTGQACSWLPEKCAPNIHVILTSAKNSLQHKNLKGRLTPPIFIDLSFPESLLKRDSVPCVCSQQWCVSRLLQNRESLCRILSVADSKGIGEETVRIMSVFYRSLVCSLSQSQIEFVLSYSFSHSQIKDSKDSFDEKDAIEPTEKSTMNIAKKALKWNKSDRTERALLFLVHSKILSRAFLKNTTETSYSLSIPQLKPLMSSFILERITATELEMVQCYLGAFFIYHSTDLDQQLLFVPTHLQYLSSVKDVVFKEWLLPWVILRRFTDEYSVPVTLLTLWRSILGEDTDYSPMLNAYISTCFDSMRTACSSCSSSCHLSTDVTLRHGSVCLDLLFQPAIGLSRKATRTRCRVLLELARLAMQVGQYSVSKEMARVLLKLLDQSCSDRSLLTIPGPDKHLLVSCLHLLFCTLDERLKTYEFVTEQTTPIFRRTLHYGARALLLQNSIVEQLQRTLREHRSCGSSGDGVPLNVERLQQKLCSAEVRLARIMTHFVFSLDGVEQSAINRLFLPSKIRAVTCVFMTRALEIATRLKERCLLLEIQMTFGVIQPRENCKEKILLYKTPLRGALCTFGHGHIFVSRIFINIGISYEEQKKYIKAFEYFTLWSHITHELLGRNHCKSVRSCGVFKEPIFKLTAEFIDLLNGELVSDSLEGELTNNVGRVVDNHNDGDDVELSVEGVSIGNSGAAGGDSVSLENLFAYRSSVELDTDWEVHSSDDETPDYTTAFEEVIDKFHKRCTSTQSVELLHSLLKQTSSVDSDDLSQEDIDFLLHSHEVTQHRLMAHYSDSRDGAAAAAAHGGEDDEDETVVEALRVSRMFRGLQDLPQFFPANSLSSHAEINLARRLVELQRDLQNFLNN